MPPDWPRPQKHPMMQPPERLGYSWWITAALFLIAAAMVGGTVAGPGLSWDEPAYRGSGSVQGMVEIDARN